MKYVKMLGLLAVAVAALMASASTASADLTESAGDYSDIGDTIHASSSGATSLTGTISITCSGSTLGGTVTDNFIYADVAVHTFTFSGCGNHTVTVKSGGELKISPAGTVISFGAEITVLLHSIFLGTVHCIYRTENTDIGDLTGGTQAKIDIVSKSIPRAPTDGACGEHSTWEGSYTVTTPHELSSH